MTRHALFRGHRSRFCFSPPPSFSLFRAMYFTKRFQPTFCFALDAEQRDAKEIVSRSRDLSPNFAECHEGAGEKLCCLWRIDKRGMRRLAKKCCLRSSLENFLVGLKICDLNDTFCGSKYWTCVRHASSCATSPAGKKNITCAYYFDIFRKNVSSAHS